MDPTDECITYLVVRERHTWNQKRATIPVSQIALMEEETVYLKLDRRQITATGYQGPAPRVIKEVRVLPTRTLLASDLRKEAYRGVRA